MKYKNILAIGAHPDDVEYGCFGFLLEHKAQSNIHVYVMSVGSVAESTPAQRRIEETTQALSTLQPQSLIVRDKKGIVDENFQSILSDLEEIIKRVKPDLILTHGPHDTHQEHKLCYEIVISAARRRKMSILRYSIVSNTSYFRPNYFFEFSRETLENKIEQLAYHNSQGDRKYMSREYLLDYHHRPYTMLHDIEYCEAFEVERIMI